VTPAVQINLQVGRSAASDSRDVEQFQDGVKMVAISLLLTAWNMMSTDEFSVEEFSQQSIFRHPDYVADPSQLLRDN